jgi:hypothetical protein
MRSDRLFDGWPLRESRFGLRPERLDVPLGWRQPRMVFVNSMSDMWHPLVPADFIDQVFSVMQEADRHTYAALSFGRLGPERRDSGRLALSAQPARAGTLRTKL